MTTWCGVCGGEILRVNTGMAGYSKIMSPDPWGDWCVVDTATGLRGRPLEGHQLPSNARRMSLHACPPSVVAAARRALW